MHATQIRMEDKNMTGTWFRFNQSRKKFEEN